MIFKNRRNSSLVVIINEDTHKTDLVEFSNILSHKVRGPVTTILGLSRLLRDNPNSGDKNTIITGIEQSALELDNALKTLSEIISKKNS
jgi:signal transduction histidine kinase